MVPLPAHEGGVGEEVSVLFSDTRVHESINCAFQGRDMAVSRQSFRMAMDNPCGYFVDVI